MNLGWIMQDRRDDDLRQVILHEFGHALGCVHEHQSPLQDIVWNKEQVYTDLGGPPNNWSRDKVDSNMFKKYDFTVAQQRMFDLASIMLYYCRSFKPQC